jgi:hypothetical protein
MVQPGLLQRASMPSWRFANVPAAFITVRCRRSFAVCAMGFADSGRIIALVPVTFGEGTIDLIMVLPIRLFALSYSSTVTCSTMRTRGTMAKLF